MVAFLDICFVRECAGAPPFEPTLQALFWGFFISLFMLEKIYMWGCSRRNTVTMGFLCKAYPSPVLQQ